MRVLLTGGTGFIGSNLYRELIKEHEVICLGRPNENNIPFTDQPLNFKIDGKIDVCFHQAANNDTLDLNEKRMKDDNVFMPFGMFEGLFHYNGCRKFIYASSASVYGNGKIPCCEEDKLDPLNPYAKSKLMFEQCLEDYPAICVGLRYSNVYGNNEHHKGRRASMVFQIIQKYINGEQIKLFSDGNQRRDWVHVNDVVQANLLAMNATESTIYNCGSGVSNSFNEIVEEISKDINIEYIDCSFKEAFQNHTCLNIEKINKELGYVPKYDLKTGIKEILNNFTKKVI